jgi:hypothetical protein
MSGPHARPKTALPGTKAARPSVPCWVDVEELLARLADTGEPIPTALAPSTRICSYQRGDRLRLESDDGSKWLAVESIRECWETFERLGRIRQRDVLDPGRRSAFMYALFRRVPGVVEQADDDPYLVLPVGR